MADNKEYVIVLRVRVDDETLEAYGRYKMEKKKSTLKDFKEWCYGTLNADIEDMIGSPEANPEEHRRWAD